LAQRSPTCCCSRCCRRRWLGRRRCTSPVSSGSEYSTRHTCAPASPWLVGRLRLRLWHRWWQQQRQRQRQRQRQQEQQRQRQQEQQRQLCLQLARLLLLVATTVVPAMVSLSPVMQAPTSSLVVVERTTVRGQVSAGRVCFVAAVCHGCRDVCGASQRQRPTRSASQTIGHRWRRRSVCYGVWIVQTRSCSRLIL
jgi:hypothetical protein